MFLVGLLGVLFALLISYSYTATHSENRYAKFWDRRIISLNCVAGLLALLAFASGVVTILIKSIKNYLEPQ